MKTFQDCFITRHGNTRMGNVLWEGEESNSIHHVVSLNLPVISMFEYLEQYDTGGKQGLLSPASIPLYLPNYCNYPFSFVDDKRNKQVSMDKANIIHKWIVLDGAMNTGWADNMNTLLGSDKTLCLPSGQTIKLKSECTQ